MLMAFFTFSACQNQHELSPEECSETAKSQTMPFASQDIPEGIKIVTATVTEPSVSIHLYMYQPVTIVWGDGQQEYVPKNEVKYHTYTDGLSEHTIEFYEMGAASTIIDFGCADNGLTSLDISHCSELETLEIRQGTLTTLDLSHNAMLNSLFCPELHLEQLDLSNNPLLTFLECSGNLLTALDATHNPSLYQVMCSNNPFVSDAASLTNFALTLPNRTGQPSGSLYLDNAAAAAIIKDICTARNWNVR